MVKIKRSETRYITYYFCVNRKRFELTQVRYSYRPQLRDPDDEFILEAAINGSAEAIVTFNIADFLPAAKDFGIEVLQPGRIIRERLTR